MKHNEDSRVKIPALLHICRLGYEYIPRAQCARNMDTNIFPEIFKRSIARINPALKTAAVERLLADISMELDNDDLGKAFYRRLLEQAPVKLIDFANMDNNEYHVVTELSCEKDYDEFRPDITVLINGMPLVFIEVKKPNNRNGILAERERINTRFKNVNFRKFMNITQLIVFSNNQEYDDDTADPVQGAFYATPDPRAVKFNRFREECSDILTAVMPDSAQKEQLILKDNNLLSIINTPEYQMNKAIDTPTNRLLTSLISRERLRMILQYAIAYVENPDAIGVQLEKHIMRYPQIFATKAIEAKLAKGIKKGVVWHTQGSGKTALAYYNVHYLTDYYQRQRTIAKFYFIVDRLDLATQARNEFVARGLKVEMVNSREDFIKNISTAGAVTGNRGDRAITVVNIQKFSEDSVASVGDYDLNVQRVYFLDEVHRSYKPTGSFLANLIASDRAAVLIGLTGTPLISGDYKTKEIFGDYIHKYYYNKSIADGYTLRLLREDIETKFRYDMKEVYNNLVEKGSIAKKDVYAHERFVQPLVAYIADDLNKFRLLEGDNSVGGMIVCDSSDQAKAISAELHKRAGYRVTGDVTKDSFIQDVYSLPSSSDLANSLILHDIGTKISRTNDQSDFKAGKLDLLVVYNMLLTGFDAPRLKKLYLLRKIDKHNLLQALTRVNRPYKKLRYGRVVDFADITEEFDKTNKEYFKELEQELGEEAKNYTNLMKTSEEIAAEIEEIKEKLFVYDFSNLEQFSRDISQINDKNIIMDLKRCLDNLKALYNTIKLQGFKELQGEFAFEKVNKLCSEVAARIDIINLNDSLDNAADNNALLNIALESMQFSFRKLQENELQVADKFREQLEKTRMELQRSYDKDDKDFITLREELKRIFKRYNIEEMTAADMQAATRNLVQIYDGARELNRKDALLAQKYRYDEKYARLHKRVEQERMNKLGSLAKLSTFLLSLKDYIDTLLANNSAILNNREYFIETVRSEVVRLLWGYGVRDLAWVAYVVNKLTDEYSNERVA